MTTTATIRHPDKPAPDPKLSPARKVCAVVIGLWRFVRLSFRQQFCRHDWQLHSRNRYAVTRANGSKEGEVTLTLLKCRACRKDWLIPSDRTHEPNNPGQTAGQKP